MVVFFTLFKQILYRLKKYNIPKLVLFLLIVIAAGTAGILFFEKEANPHFSTVKDGLWWLLVTITTVGYGDKYPVTPGGMILGVLIMVLGIGLLGMFTATIASVFVEAILKEGMGLGKMRVKKHILICGWNSKAREIIAEFQSKIGKRIGRIGVIANIDNKPVEDWTIGFVRGEPSNEEVLKRANIEKAETVIILADQQSSKSEEDSDAKSILTTLTVKSLNPRVYVCLELLDSSNRRHGEMAKADEIIVSSEMSSRLLSRAALDHGISQFYSEIITSKFGNEIMKIELPPGYVGKSFDDRLVDVRQTYKAILLGVVKRDEIITNPEPGYIFTKEDKLLILGQEIPEP